MRNKTSMNRVAFIKDVPPGPVSCGATIKLLEIHATSLGQLVTVDSRSQVDEPAAQLFGAHLLGAEIDVEEGTHFPCLVAEQPTLALEPRVQGRSGERRLDRDLDVEQFCFHGELQNAVEYLGPLAIEPEDEAAIDPDAG